MRRLALILVVSLALVAPTQMARADEAPPARAGGAGDVELVDLLAQLPGIIAGLVVNRADMLRCPDLAGGTIGLPESPGEPGRRGVDHGNPLVAGQASDAPASLPRQVRFRSTTETFNRRYQFALSDGRIWYKSNRAVTGIVEPWARLKASPCFDGNVAGISVDDDELIAIDKQRWIYGMDGALKSPNFFNWSLRWGPPLWTGPGWKLPAGIKTWTWSVLSQVEDTTWPDDAGNDHAVGAGKVSHIWALSHRGQRLTYLDPWLGTDMSYELCSPHRGRFRSVNLSASGSTVFVIGRSGDMFTRLYDFDIAGADPIFFDYSYDDQRGAAKPVIQLPSPAWRRQPKVPGRITDRISIHKMGRGSRNRELRVEGKRRGRVGYWHKDVSAKRWLFTRTGGSLQGTRLRNPARRTSAQGLAPSENRRYRGIASGARVVIRDFNTYCTPSTVRVRLPEGDRVDLRLHTVDNIREFTRARGLDETPRMFNGTLDIPPALRGSASPAVRKFVAALGPGRFVRANLDATAGTVRFRQQRWTLNLVR